MKIKTTKFAQLNIFVEVMVLLKECVVFKST